MSTNRDSELIEELLQQGAEKPWLEFKENLADSERIGKLISALSNAARLEDRDNAFIVWGVSDDLRVVGTSFDPDNVTVGSQNLHLWLKQALSPAPAFHFREHHHPEGRIVLLEIPSSTLAPTAFQAVPYIRVGSATPKLSDDHFRYQALIEKLRPYTWESGVAATFQTREDVLQSLDYSSYFRLTGQAAPIDPSGVLSSLETDRLIKKDVGERWDILNLGALLFAQDLASFSPSVARKGVRFVRYEGSDRTTTVTHRRDGKRGYAVGFEGLMEFINGLLPQNEHIGQALRQAHPLFPQLSLRELVANALIHQDLTISGAGPMIELFSDRIEITNPGKPLIETDRMIDLPPRSRNEAMASLMRRMNICEEQGSGLDKVFREVEIYQLPAPLLSSSDASMQVVLFGPRSFADMTVDERVRACYFHAVLCFVGGGKMKNATLCERFGIDKRNAAQATGVLNRALKAGLIKYADEDHPRAGYHPWWA